ncbi:hypothetical protein AAFX91_22430 [Bradyrhizobium sp. 31Argb]|uniref:hypothetical protein n=1 Tax=Bradyrhizobium TaxID=374 RepID=UPI0004192A97|nr:MULTISPECIES: hypothetical protein [Bradyrhizobium]
MLADPHHSCIVLLNPTRGRTDALAALRSGSLFLLPVCHEFFAVPQFAVGAYERDALPDQITASLEHVDLDALTLWRDHRFAERLARADVSVIFLGGGFLEEEVLIAALEGARQGYDIRLLADLAVARLEADRALVLDRLAHHGIVATTIRQALLEWAVSLDDPAVSRKIQGLLS